MTKNRQTEREQQNLKERTAGENNEQVSLQEAPHLPDSKQNHSENSKSWSSQKEIFFIKQPSSSL
jgi:hypothetical protein